MDTKTCYFEHSAVLGHTRQGQGQLCCHMACKSSSLKQFMLYCNDTVTDDCIIYYSKKKKQTQWIILSACHASVVTR
jgi:hypothetical protein